MSIRSLRTAVMSLIASLALAGVAVAQGVPPTIYGIHDHDSGVTEFLDAHLSGHRGWVTATIEIGDNPDASNDFSDITGRGHEVIVRLNYGYNCRGSIPPRWKWDRYAAALGTYAANTTTARIFVIGNETNLPIEWPLIEDPSARITPADYAEFFQKAYDAIKARRPDAQVVTQALAPFAAFTSGTVCGGRPHGPSPAYSADYHRQMLNAILNRGIVPDGIAVHVNSRTYDLGRFDETNVLSDGRTVAWSFNVHREWVDYTPSALWSKPFYATETNGTWWWSDNPDPGNDYRAGWMQKAYETIDSYNAWAASHGRPLYRCLNPYRWCEWCDGHFGINGSGYEGQIRSDYDVAVSRDYTWTTEGDRGAPRVQYQREYWVIDSRATQAQVEAVGDLGYAGRKTIGFSYDDAGIGDLDVRRVVVWGTEFDRSVLRSWYAQHYGGVSVEFRSIPGQPLFHYGPYATSEPASGRGQPRVQYAREYWVVNSNATRADFLRVVRQAYANGRRTVGFSYDDAGIGNLDTRHVVVWGNEFADQVLRDWYSQHYPGVTVEFRHTYP
jgi:hypothetical protein